MAIDELLLLREVYEKNSSSKSQMFRCYKTFKEERKEVDEFQHVGSSWSFQTSDDMAKIYMIFCTWWSVIKTWVSKWLWGVGT